MLDFNCVCALSEPCIRMSPKRYEWQPTWYKLVQLQLVTIHIFSMTFVNVVSMGIWRFIYLAAQIQYECCTRTLQDWIYSWMKSKPLLTYAKRLLMSNQSFSSFVNLFLHLEALILFYSFHSLISLFCLQNALYLSYSVRRVFLILISLS